MTAASIKRIAPYGISLSCIIYVFWGIDFDSLVKSFVTFSIWPVILAQVVTIASYWLMALRLNSLSTNEVSFKKCHHASIIGAAVNNILPAKLGEGAKVVILAQTDGLSAKDSLSIVFWERFADLNIVLLLGALVTMDTGSVSLLLPLSAIIAVIWGLIIVLSLKPKLIEEFTSIIPWAGVRKFSTELASNVTGKISFTTFTPLIIHTIIIWAFVFGGFYLILGHAVKLELSIGQMFFVFGASILGFIVPAAPAAIGVYESFIVGALLLLDVPKEEALALAITIHLTQIVYPTITGIHLFQRLTGDSLLNFFGKKLAQKN